MREIPFGLKLLLSDVDMIGVVAWGKSQGDFHVPFQYYLAFSCFCWRDKLPALLLGSQMSSRQLIVRHHLWIWWGFPADSEVKNLPANAGDAGREDPRKKEMTTHSSVLAWRMLWTEEPGGLQTMGSQNSPTQLTD